jgi:hypothetical protein
MRACMVPAQATACMRCNQRKGDRLLRDLGWKLKRTPKVR